MSLTFDEYQEKAASTAIYPPEAALLYPVLGHSGEAAELAEKVLGAIFPDGKPMGWGDVSFFMRLVYNAIEASVAAGLACQKIKKQIRDETATLPEGVLAEIKRRVDAIPEHSRPGILKEIGGNLWYASAIARDMNDSLSKVAQTNLDILAARKAKGTIGGSGDCRE